MQQIRHLVPDGFSVGFFHKYWEIVKEDVKDTIKNFQCNEYFEKCFNASYIALIPQKK